MSRATLRRDGIVLAYEDVGEGPSVVFQHGLGADANQIAEIFPPEAPVRRITLECRGQGQSELGPREALSIATFADDVLFLAEHLGIRRAMVGGLSMGAAIALRIAVMRPELVRGLILSRPAWLFDVAPESMQPFALAGALLAKREGDAAWAAFHETAVAQRLAREAPDNLASLRDFFTRPARHAIAALISAIAADGPRISKEQARRLAVPTLVIGHRDDLVHPFDHAARLAAAIPSAELVEITSKVASHARYVADFRAAIAAFIAAHPA